MNSIRIITLVFTCFVEFKTLQPKDSLKLMFTEAHSVFKKYSIEY